MEPVAWLVAQHHLDSTAVNGLVSAVNVPDFERGSGFLFRKGDLLTLAQQPDLPRKLDTLNRTAPTDYVWHLIRMTQGDVSEDEAARQLAQLVAGSGIEMRPPVESRVHLLARHRGVLRVDIARLEQLNEVEGVAVFTLYDGTAVEAGTEVAGVKVTPLVYPQNRLAEAAERVGARIPVSTIPVSAIPVSTTPVIDVWPFRAQRVGIIVREQLAPKARQRFATAVEHKLAWFGAESLGIRLVENDLVTLEAALLDFKQQGASLILHVGGHSSDPLDPIFTVLPRLGIKMERHGAPAHPGTLFWLAYWDELALFGLASCGMFSRTTLGDLFLARLLAGEHLTARTIAKMGHGGLFTHDMAFRFPPYGLTLDEQD